MAVVVSIVSVDIHSIDQPHSMHTYLQHVCTDTAATAHVFMFWAVVYGLTAIVASSYALEYPSVFCTASIQKSGYVKHVRAAMHGLLHGMPAAHSLTQHQTDCPVPSRPPQQATCHVTLLLTQPMLHARSRAVQNGQHRRKLG